MIIKCQCGHEGSATSREKDSPWSSYEIWTFTGWNCKDRQVEKPGQMSLEEAIKKAEPKCPKCGEHIDANTI